MGDLKIKDKDIVVPGEILAAGMDFLPSGGAFREGEDIIASQVGVVSIDGRLVKVVPLAIKYIPKRGDMVIGTVEEVTNNGWFVDFGYSNFALIPLRDGSMDYIPKGADLTQYYNYGDYVVANITNVTKSKQVDLSMKGPGLRKLSEGVILKVNPAKVPRIIGKQGSMISMVKTKTDCRIVVGQNGLIWIYGIDPVKEKVAVDTIKMIDEKAHIQGLTDEVSAYLEKKVGGEKRTTVDGKEGEENVQ
ncbi:MAG: exosome complex RNA-binding protein Rrp4 [Nanoarchaeota archaeon]